MQAVAALAFHRMMKNLALLLVAACLSVPAVSAQPTGVKTAQSRAERKAQRKQAKAMKKMLKAQRRNQRKMEKYDRKHTHDPMRPKR